MGFCSIILVVWLIYLVGQAFSKRPLSLYQTQWGCVGSFSWWMQSSQKCWTGWRSNPTPFGTGSIKWWMQRGFYQTFMQKQNGGKTQQRWEGVKKAPGVEFNHSRWSGSWVCCWGWVPPSSRGNVSDVGKTTSNIKAKRICPKHFNCTSGCRRKQRGEKFLHRYGEKLALALGLMKIPPGMPIRIMKNLQL